MKTKLVLLVLPLVLSACGQAPLTSQCDTLKTLSWSQAPQVALMPLVVPASPDGTTSKGFYFFFQPPSQVSSYVAASGAAEALPDGTINLGPCSVTITSGMITHVQ